MSIELTDKDIERFLKERKPLPSDYRKHVTTKPKCGHKENELTVKGADGSEFVLILRQANVNPLDFSVILGFQMPESTRVFRLRRCNGKHGQHTNPIEGITFYDFHIHTATERYQDLGLREDTYAEATDRFWDFSTAIDCMLKDCAFDVPPNPQGHLFDPQE